MKVERMALAVTAAILFFAGTSVGTTTPRTEQGLVAQHAPTEDAVQMFTGIVQRSGGDFILTVSTAKTAYRLDDRQMASQYEGKRVEVTGTVDVVTNIIHVQNIREVA